MTRPIVSTFLLPLPLPVPLSDSWFMTSFSEAVWTSKLVDVPEFLRYCCSKLGLAFVFGLCDSESGQVTREFANVAVVRHQVRWILCPFDLCISNPPG